MAFKGINHMAMVTGDMEKTTIFYRDVLGMPLVSTIGNVPGRYPYRHYFFEWPGMVEEFHKPAGSPAKGPIQFDHVSFNVDDEEALLVLQARLKVHGIEVTEVIDHQIIRSIYFTDPNGIALEASFWVKDPTGMDHDYSDPFFFGDPDPVPSARPKTPAA
jgi:catechol 2,3-dioxygenase-like lactoylglutathione lyase family enzyme